VGQQTTGVEATETRKFPPRKYVPPNKTAAVFNGIKNLFGVAALLLGAWTALMTAFTIGPNLITLKYLDGYEPATFTVRQLNFTEGSIQTGQNRRSYLWADGVIDGSQEKYFWMGAYVKGTVNSQEELEQWVHVGQELKVLYNPEVPRSLEEHRVVSPKKDFKKYWKGFQQRRLRETYYPLGVSLLLCLVCGVLARNIIGAIGFVVGSSLMVLLVLVPTVWNLLL
jgi:hypothetical protein